MRKIQIINGPNLNKLGVRNPEVYGNLSFDEYLENLRKQFPRLELDYFQSNLEGEIIDKLQEIDSLNYQGVVLNAGGYTHTSVSIRDAIESIKVPVVEVHISNISAREEFRHTSLITPVCKGIISGFGLKSYSIALSSFLIEF